MAPTTAERGREVRQLLVRAATELIAERGWTAVSTRILAERAGVVPGLVHYHFASLQALLNEAAVGAMRAAIDGLGSLLDQARTPDDALDLLLGSVDQYTGQDPMSLLFTETYLAATRDPALRAEVVAVITAFLGRFAQWLDGHGVDAPEQTAAVLAAAIDGVLLHRVLNPAVTAAAVAPVLRRILTPAVTGRSRTRKAGED
ncbi:MAG TPA: TetR/AcrR family transcriptional regulator [Pseudonocardiaceae bacterium]